jgi:hypothetical protein
MMGFKADSGESAKSSTGGGRPMIELLIIAWWRGGLRAVGANPPYLLPSLRRLPP